MSIKQEQSDKHRSLVASLTATIEVEYANGVVTYSQILMRSLVLKEKNTGK